MWLIFALQSAFTQVPIVVLNGTNFIDYRVLNTNFYWLNYGIGSNALAIGTPAPSTNGPWARQSNAWVEIKADTWPAVSGAVTAAASSWPTVSGAVTEAAFSWPTVSGAVTTAAATTNGIPTNNAVLIAESTGGRGQWKAFPKFHASLGTAKLLSPYLPIAYNITNYQYGGNWNGTYWTPGIIGWLSFTAQIVGDNKYYTGSQEIILRKNDASYLLSGRPVWANQQYPTVNGSWITYNDNITNTWSIMNGASWGALTNYGAGVYNYFMGTAIP